MKSRAIQQGGKENDRLSCKGSKRKMLKSPLKIREKIRELEVEAQRNEKKASLSKGKPVKVSGQEPHRIFVVTPQTAARVPLQHLERDRSADRSIRKTSSPFNLEPRLKQAAQMESGMSKASKSPKERPKSPQNYQGLVVHKASSRTLASENGQLVHLKEENERYKRIYSHSLEKMQQLEAKLYAIRRQHQAEKQQLEGKMLGLKQRIEQKKVNLGHLYTHPQQNFLFVHDCIITETQNESSSILENFSKRFQPSSLSIDSR